MLGILASHRSGAFQATNSLRRARIVMHYALRLSALSAPVYGSCTAPYVAALGTFRTFRILRLPAHTHERESCLLRLLFLFSRVQGNNRKLKKMEKCLLFLRGYFSVGEETVEKVEKFA